MIIDCHAHVNWYGMTAEKLVRNMDEMGIDKSWLFSWEMAAPEEMDMGYAHVLYPHTRGLPLEHVIRAVEKFPERFIPMHAVDPRVESAPKVVRSCASFGIRGFGELKLRMLYDDPRLIELYHVCAELKFPVTFHIDVPWLPPVGGKYFTHWYGGRIDNIERALQACPNTIFVGHAPGFWREVSGDADKNPDVYPSGPVAPGGRLPKLMETYPNLHCDLSAGSALRALSRDPEFGKGFLTRFQDRCLFGRDYFDDAMMKFLKSLELPQDAFDKIAGGNALRLVPA
ncbi:MAG TPA: amidohydrolase family protein [Candidatus Brocadiia bacterium]|nr:amidohydrolase family protein [Candidatus Brocadiia bacterium]